MWIWWIRIRIRIRIRNTAGNKWKWSSMCAIYETVHVVANTFMWTILRIYLLNSAECFMLLWRIVHIYRNVEFTLKGTVCRDLNRRF
jgi:hypothetical protein